jgi:hypothetical protein
MEAIGHEAEANLAKEMHCQPSRPAFPGLEHAKAAVLNSLSSTDAKPGSSVLIAPR